MSTEHLHSRDFAECLHTIFQFRADSGEMIPLQLIDVIERNYSERTEQFGLRFKGPATPFLPQKAYIVSHDKLGELMLFTVPLGPQDGAMSYEVVFNRIRREDSGSP